MQLPWPETYPFFLFRNFQMEKEVEIDTLNLYLNKKVSMNYIYDLGTMKTNKI